MEADEKELLWLKYRSDRKLQAQKDRAEITNQYARGCTLMNGGGAVALLAFSGAIIKLDDFSFLAPWVALAIIAFVLGLVSIGLAYPYRVEVSHKVEAKEAAEDEKEREQLKKEIAKLSKSSHRRQNWAIRFFFIGCMIFAASIFLKFGFPTFAAKQTTVACDLAKDSSKPRGPSNVN